MYVCVLKYTGIDEKERERERGRRELDRMYTKSEISNDFIRIVLQVSHFPTSVSMAGYNAACSIFFVFMDPDLKIFYQNAVHLSKK